MNRKYCGPKGINPILLLPFILLLYSVLNNKMIYDINLMAQFWSALVKVSEWTATV